MFDISVSIFIFAFFGGISRYLISQWINFATFPLSTLLINLIGCFCFALIASYFNTKKMPNWLTKGFSTGFLGAFTTLSSFNLDFYHLVQAHHLHAALLYFSISVFGGLFCIWFGYFLGAQLFATKGGRNHD